MVKMKSLIVVLLIVLVGISVTFLFFPSEEKKVMKRFALLSEHVSKGSEENAFMMANKIKGISDLFAGIIA